MDNAQLTAQTTEDELGTQLTGKWQSLSPIAMLYFTSSLVRQLAGNFIYLIPALAFSYKSILEHPFIWLPAIGLALGLLGLFAFLSFKVYRYRLTDSHIEIRSGVFQKAHLNLPFSRVQNVKIEQPIYYRLSGHACLQLDTAGSAKNEAKLVAIRLELAQQLKEEIQQQVNEQTDNCDDTVSEDVALNAQNNKEQLLNKRKLSDLVIHGITSNRIWILLGGLAPFYDNMLATLGDGLAQIGIDFQALFSLETHSLFEVALYAISLTMLVMLLLVSFSVAGAIISFYGYTLSKLGDKYIRRSGLLTKHEVSMRLSRLQMIIRKQDWLDLMLNRINLKLEQNNSLGKNFDPSAGNSKIIVPSIRPAECHAIIDDAYPNNQLADLIKGKLFSAISKRFIFRNILLVFTPIFMLAIVLAYVDQKYALLAVLFLVYLLVCMLVVLRWKRWGFAYDQEFIYIRKGLVGVDYYCFPSFKIQQCQFKQSVMMRSRHLASVKFILASGSVIIPMIDQDVAYSLINDSLYQVENSQQSWM
jgi:putative membrane protein